MNDTTDILYVLGMCYGGSSDDAWIKPDTAKDAIQCKESVEKVLVFIGRDLKRRPTILNTSEMKVDREVYNEASAYFKNEGMDYEVVEIYHKSNHTEDDYLYMVIARKVNKCNNYAYWSCWNRQTGSLNHGHYDYESLEDCMKAARKALNNTYQMEQK